MHTFSPSDTYVLLRLWGQFSIEMLFSNISSTSPPFSVTIVQENFLLKYAAGNAFLSWH